MKLLGGLGSFSWRHWEMLGGETDRDAGDSKKLDKNWKEMICNGDN